MIFNTYSRLVLDAGVLIFWTIFSIGTMTSFTFWVRWRDRRRPHHHHPTKHGNGRKVSVGSRPGSVKGGKGKGVELEAVESGKGVNGAGAERGVDGGRDADVERWGGRREDREDEEGEEEDETWKRTSVDLGLAPIESRRSGTEVIAFQA